MNAPEIWLSMPKSSGVAMCGVPEKLPAKHRRHCHLAQVDTSYGWNDQQFRALDLGLFASCCSVLFVYTTVMPLLYTSTVIKKLSFHQKKGKIPFKISLRPSPMRRTSGYWRNGQIQLNLYKCFGPCFLANQFAVVSLVIGCGNARAQRELRRCCLYLYALSKM